MSASHGFQTTDSPCLDRDGALAALVSARGHAGQLYQYASLLHQLKPAMDDWILVPRVSKFVETCRRLGLTVLTDVVFTDAAAEDRQAFRDRLCTTRSAAMRWYPAESYPEGSELHVFIGTGATEAREAWAHGWYPVLIGGRPIAPPPADLRAFGLSLGYPQCCVDAFVKQNDWRIVNSYETAMIRTISRPSALSTPFGRHTAWSYIFHLPCSFDCPSTMSIAARLREAIQSSEPAYARQIGEFHRSSFLVFNEHRVYALAGTLRSSAAVAYRSSHYLGNLPEEDWYGAVLEEADEASVVGSQLVLRRSGELIAVIEPKTDCSGPESLFLIRLESS